MKTIKFFMLTAFVCLFALSLVLAASPQQRGLEDDPMMMGIDPETGEPIDDGMMARGPDAVVAPRPEEAVNARETVNARQQEQTRTGGAGQGQVTTQRVNRLRAMSREGLEIAEEDGRVRVRLANGRNAEVKIMPETASERALERLRLRNCIESEGCVLRLREKIQGNETSLVYEMDTERTARVFGLLKTRMRVRAEVDAETGEVVRVRKPWWAFLATEPAETEEAEE
jgi:hypothetical protein